MSANIRPWRFAPPLALSGLLAACAVAPPPPIPPVAALSDRQEIFEVGYRTISERYIEPVEIAAIALAGLQGFSAIDPSLHVTRDGAQVRLELNGAEIAEAPAPAPGDSGGWAALTASFESRARSRSAAMREASVEKVNEDVFDGVLSDLDVFSRYAGADEARRNRARRDGFGGVGLRFKMTSGKPIVTKVLSETPAAEAGIKVGDEITQIDGATVRGAKVEELVDRLRGPTYSHVTVTVYRAKDDRRLAASIERRHIVPESVTASVVDGIATLKISSFNQATARSVANELKKLKDSQGGRLRGLIVDLRGNPGGLLKQSVKVADLLLTHGHIVSTRGRHPDSLHHYEAGGRDLADGLPTAVLVDGKSASASEIVAAALQDRGRAVLVGTSSYGKGTVQTVIRLPNDGEVTLTWSRLAAPSGYTLHGLGVRPVVCTSGASPTAPDFVRKAVAGGLQARDVFASWRTAGYDDKAGRASLRETCKPERRTGDGEVRVARQLLADQALYAQALDITAGASQAQK